jgi:Rod binding domain-containing protein
MEPVTLPLGAVGLDGANLDDIRRTAGPRRAAEELQVVFLTHLIQALRRTVPESDFLPPSPARKVYDGLFDRAVAERLAAGDPLGLVRALGEAGALKAGGDRADTVTGYQTQGRGVTRP